MGGWEAASAGEVGGVGVSSVAVGVPVYCCNGVFNILPNSSGMYTAQTLGDTAQISVMRFLSVVLLLLLFHLYVCTLSLCSQNLWYHLCQPALVTLMCSLPDHTQNQVTPCPSVAAQENLYIRTYVYVHT